MNLDVSLFVSLVYSGHLTGTNHDLYVDRNNISVAMSGVLALNEWKNVHGVIFPTCLTYLTEIEVKHALETVDRFL